MGPRSEFPQSSTLAAMISRELCCRPRKKRRNSLTLARREHCADDARVQQRQLCPTATCAITCPRYIALDGNRLLSTTDLSIRQRSTFDTNDRSIHHNEVLRRLHGHRFRARDSRGCDARSGHQLPRCPSRAGDQRSASCTWTSAIEAARHGHS